MDLPPRLLAAADQVYAGLLDDLRSLDAPLLVADDFLEAFARRLRADLDGGPGQDGWDEQDGRDGPER